MPISSCRPLRPLRVAVACAAAAALVSCGGGGGTGAAPGGAAAASPTALDVAFTPPSAAATVAARVTATPKASPAASPTPAPTLAPSAQVTYAQVQQIFTNFCVGCHPPNQGLDLQAGKSFASIVNVPSREVPSLMRVKPGDAGQSYLYQKISQAKPASGVQMPRNGEPLTPAEQSVVRNWIEQGAKP